MKWTYLLACISIGISISACHKSSQEITLVVDQTEAAAMGEMVTAKIIGAPANARIDWQLSPGWELVEPSADRHMARILLNRSGNIEYTINAVVYPTGDSANFINLSKTISAKNDEYFTIPSGLPANTLQSMTGDQLQLRPEFSDKDSSLVLYIRTLRSYQCFSAYIVPENVTISNGNIKATFNKVWTPGNCSGPETPAQVFLYTKHYYKDGTYSLDITFNNTLYQGTIEVSKNGFRLAFLWPYSAIQFIRPDFFHSMPWKVSADGLITTYGS